MSVEMMVRCRRCENCLKQHRREWAARAMRECALWPRSYFVTCTLSPEEQYRAIAIASQSSSAEGVPYDTLTEEQQFRYRVAVIYQWFKLYWKRCRKEMGVPLRYIVVAEAHKSGDPHFHCIVHECARYTEDAWDTYSVLKSQWPHGHSVVNGIDPGDMRSVFYVTKYLSKSVLARVRASTRYGSPLGEVEDLPMNVSEGPPQNKTPVLTSPSPTKLLTP